MDATLRPEKTTTFKVKDPISSLTHFIGAIVACVATPVLLIIASSNNADIKTLISLAVYGISMILLYSASTAHHALNISDEGNRRLRKLDHMSIFILIAGSYTPVCVVALNNRAGYIMLVAIWTLAIIGILIKAFWITSPKIFSSIIYIAMGWLAIFSIRSIWSALSLPAFIWLVMGGVLYTVGGVLYSLKFSINEKWGNHEVFHLFVLAGSLCHYIMMVLIVLS